jgi:phage nucleotide-binding protein
MMAKEKKKVEEVTEDAGWDTPPSEETSEQVSAPAEEEAPAWDDSLAKNQTRGEIFIREHAGEFQEHLIKLLIYGESGAGKTRLASNFPKTLFLDIDKGMSSVTTPVDAMDIDNFDQLKSAYEYLKAGEHSYETVVIDTLNEMQRLAMRITIEDFPAVRRSYGNLPGQSDYGKMLYEFMELIRNFVNLPMRVVLLAQTNTRQFDTDMLMPQLIGKNSAREVARKMDVIGYIEKSEHEDKATGKKVSQVLFDSQYHVTKDRSFRLPAILVDASYERILEYLK